MSVNSSISEALRFNVSLGLDSKRPKCLNPWATENKARMKGGKTCSKLLSNSIYQTRRDMPLVRDGTD